MGRSASEAPGNKLLNLNDLQSSAELQSPLGFFDDPQDRNYAALRILAFLQDQGPIASVNELRQIRVSRNQVKRTSGLSYYAELLKKSSEDGEKEATLPLLTPAQVRQLRPMLCVRTADYFHRLVLVYGAIFFLGFYALHAAWRVRRFQGDQLLLPAVHFLSGLGFLMMIRLRDPLRDALLFRDFAIGVGIGCILAFLASLPDYERSPLKRLAYVPLLLSFLVSLVLIVFGSGPGLSDAKVNLHIGPVQFQPVELIKLLLLFFLAGFFADRWEFLRQLRQAPRTLPGFLRRLEIPMLRYAAPLVIACHCLFLSRKRFGPGACDDTAFHHSLRHRAFPADRGSHRKRSPGFGSLDRLCFESPAYGIRSPFHVAVALGQFRQIRGRSSRSISLELFSRRSFRRWSVYGWCMLFSCTARSEFQPAAAALIRFSSGFQPPC
jgi:hypothetical protein